MAKCGFCDERLPSVDIEVITLTAPMGTPYDGLSYSYQNCRAVLSVGVDPKVQQARIADAVVAKLRGLES